ncbi:MAG: hypothetical protein AAGI34_10325 [Pseudomonadota bacterium]
MGYGAEAPAIAGHIMVILAAVLGISCAVALGRASFAGRISMVPLIHMPVVFAVSNIVFILEGLFYGFGRAFRAELPDLFIAYGPITVLRLMVMVSATAPAWNYFRHVGFGRARANCLFLALIAAETLLWLVVTLVLE